ncbi:MAG: hypothetical protein AAF495_09285 [Pseudomonadota bacterium]
MAAIGALGTLIVGAWACDRGDFRTALPIYEFFALAGFEGFETPVGLMYLSNDSGKRDPARAIAWLRDPAKRGDARAQYGLGIAYRVEGGGAEGRQAAFVWFLESAERGFRPAQNATAIGYGTGDGVARDMVQALKWGTIAADGEMPTIFTGGVSQQDIAEAQQMALAWIAAHGEAWEDSGQ